MREPSLKEAFEMSEGQDRCDAQSSIATYTQKFQEYKKTPDFKDAIEYATSFLNSRKEKFEPGGKRDPDTPFLSDAEIRGIKESNLSRFSIEESRRDAFNIVFSNALNAALFKLEKNKLIKKERLTEVDNLVFEDKTIAFMGFLYRRYEASRRPQNPTKSITLTEAIPYFSKPRSYGSRHTKIRVRDQILPALSEVGIISGSYFSGSGYSIYVGPVLVATIEHAVEPWLLKNEF